MDDVITTAALAGLLGISTRSIRQHAKDGILVRAGLLGVPSRTQQRLPHSHLAEQDVAEIDHEVRDVLTAIGEEKTPAIGS